MSLEVKLLSPDHSMSQQQHGRVLDSPKSSSTLTSIYFYIMSCCGLQYIILPGIFPVCVCLVVAAVVVLRQGLCI